MQSFPPPPENGENGDNGTSAAPPSEEAQGTEVSAEDSASPPSGDGDELHQGGENALPPPADAPFFSIPVNSGFLAIVCVCLAFGVFAPLVLSDSANTDRYALFCFVPAVLFAVYAGIRHRADVHFRQLVVRFATGFLLLAPMSWIAALICIGISLVLVSIIAAFVPLPGYVFGVLFVLLAFGSITSMEILFMWTVLTKHDSIRSLQGSPRQYPFFAAAIALGMSTASTYFLILFLRSLIDEANQQRCDRWASGGDHRPTNASTVAPYPDGNARSFVALAADAARSSRSSSDCGDKVSGEELIILLIAAVCLIQPMMVLASYHLGLVAARVQLLEARISAIAEAAPSVLFRTVFLSSFILAPRWIGPFALLLLLVIVTVFFGFIKRYEHKMPRSYLDRVGYLNIFGYGALPQSDDAEPQQTTV